MGSEEREKTEGVRISVTGTSSSGIKGRGESQRERGHKVKVTDLKLDVCRRPWR